jgi:two-component system sensor histidine kinase YesM
LAVLSVILVYFIRGYTRPIEQLYQAAVSVSEGSLETKVNIRTNDELELLGNAFNQMLDSINSYIVQMEQHEKEKKEMELEQLLLQINPHFIYNTLNTIVYMAQIKGHDDIIQYTNAFIGLLQDTLKIEKEGSLVGLDAEIATIQKYLMLMSYRYPNRFQTIYSIDESVEMCRVPSVMLQPIVENAIFHGLAISKKPGVLEISAKRQDEDVVIEVEDNGCGMSEETLRKIWTDEGNNRDTMRKIGISNVRKRLKAMYGENCSFTIESEEGKGTRVRIRIPYQ